MSVRKGSLTWTTGAYSHMTFFSPFYLSLCLSLFLSYSLSLPKPHLIGQYVWCCLCVLSVCITLSTDTKTIGGAETNDEGEKEQGPQHKWTEKLKKEKKEKLRNWVATGNAAKSVKKVWLQIFTVMTRLHWQGCNKWKYFCNRNVSINETI